MSNQKGVTLLETILVLAIIAIIMIGGLSLYSNARNSMLATQTVRQVSGLAAGIKSTFSNMANYEDLISGWNDGYSTLKSAGVIPKGMYSDNNDSGLQSAFGEQVFILGVPDANDTDYESIGIWLREVPQKLCYKIVIQAEGVEWMSRQGTDCAPNFNILFGCVKGKATFQASGNGMIPSLSTARALCHNDITQLLMVYN